MFVNAYKHKRGIPRPGWCLLIPITHGLVPFNLTQNSYTIGSSESCDIVLTYNYISRQHVVIRRIMNKLQMRMKLQNIGKNIVFVNKKPVLTGIEVTLKYGNQVSFFAQDGFDRTKKLAYFIARSEKIDNYMVLKRYQNEMNCSQILLRKVSEILKCAKCQQLMDTPINIQPCCDKICTPCMNEMISKKLEICFCGYRIKTFNQDKTMICVIDAYKDGIGMKKIWKQQQKIALKKHQIEQTISFPPFSQQEWVKTPEQGENKTTCSVKQQYRPVVRYVPLEKRVKLLKATNMIATEAIQYVQFHKKSHRKVQTVDSTDKDKKKLEHKIRYITQKFQKYQQKYLKMQSQLAQSKKRKSLLKIQPLKIQSTNIELPQGQKIGQKPLVPKIRSLHHRKRSILKKQRIRKPTSEQRQQSKQQKTIETFQKIQKIVKFQDIPSNKIISIAGKCKSCLKILDDKDKGKSSRCGACLQKFCNPETSPCEGNDQLQLIYHRITQISREPLLQALSQKNGELLLTKVFPFIPHNEQKIIIQYMFAYFNGDFSFIQVRGAVKTYRTIRQDMNICESCWKLLVKQMIQRFVEMKPSITNNFTSQSYQTMFETITEFQEYKKTFRSFQVQQFEKDDDEAMEIQLL